MTKARNIADLGSNDVIETTATGVTVTGEVVSDGLSLGDNDKATFGASDDLQIYHDGGNSFIKDTGDGILFVQGSGGVRVLGSDTSESLARFNENGSVQLYHDNAEKLATTATGVDVTGTVTADGLTVDGNGAIKTGTGGILSIGSTNLSTSAGDLVGKIEFETSDISGNATNVEIRAISNDVYGRTNLDFRTGDSGVLKTRALVGWNGDVSFYEDTGTTAKMVWDASAESLSVGNAAGFGALRVGHVGDKVEALVIGDNTTHTSDTGIYLRSDTLGVISVGSTASLSFKTGGGSGTERARLDSSGNLLVGTSASSSKWSAGNGVDRGVEIRNNNFGIAMHTANECLLLNTDSITAFSRFYYRGTAVGNIATNGSSTFYNTTSDERAKKNIKDADHSVDINDIKIREFDWKVDDKHERYGVIAQELETVYPEAVHSPKDPDELKGVDYSKLVPLLVKEIQTLKARIETLENN